MACSLQLQNNSVLPVTFSMHLDSLSRTRAEDQQQLPQFLSSSSQRTEVVGLGDRRRLQVGKAELRPPPTGTQNLSGQSVFSVAPVKGVLDPGKTQDFTVTFSPDHESLYFSDRLQVVLFEKVRLWLRARPLPHPGPDLSLHCPLWRPKGTMPGGPRATLKVVGGEPESRGPRGPQLIPASFP
ncbi:Cilia- and flagella-associated protein 74 [Saguinus oedipus]|uniref:Cilia- and flagella-associated protein 74 n=1 Tax=Saguinus oedipus TaxID=9490 RepID=A0ABQ9V8Y0_SAGOE|nr:Cilia- and flagella-associated protein 74 [Saguinus oedipus]